MSNETKKYYGSIEAFRQFLKNCKTTFAAIAHTHTKEEITDLVIDTEMSETSENPIQNKVVKAEINSINANIDAVQSDIEKKSDWNQNDENAVDYVKNRTHWADVSTVSFLGEMTFENNWASLDILEGISCDESNTDKLLVTFDGITYEVEKFIYNYEPTTAWGDSRLVSNIESDINPIDVPFLITATKDYGIFGTGEENILWQITLSNELNSSSHTLKIDILGDVSYHTLDENFIPETIARTEYVDEAIASIPTPDVSGQIETHNTATDAHNDIRHYITNLEEIVAYIDSENNESVPDEFAPAAPVDPMTATEEGFSADAYKTKAAIEALSSEVDEKIASIPIPDVNDHTHEIDDINGLEDSLGVGEDVTGRIFTVYGYEDDDYNISKELTAGTNAEIFNDYNNNIAIGAYSHVEGEGNKAYASWSHVEGRWTIADGRGAAHAEGEGSIAKGLGAHAEGQSTQAKGDGAHTEGCWTKADANYAHAEGECTVTSSESQHVQGRYNIEDVDGVYAHIVGNGYWDENTYNEIRSNAHTLDWEGNAWYAGDVTTGSGNSLDDTAASINDIKINAAYINATEGESEEDPTPVSISVIDPAGAEESDIGSAADAYKTKVAIDNINEKVGSTDISDIGDGTITGAIGALEESSFITRRRLTSDDDLDTIIEPGIYLFSTKSVPQNCPFSNAGVVEVTRFEDSHIVQRITRVGTDGQSAERVYDSGTWRAWVTRCSPVSLNKALQVNPTPTGYTKVGTITIPAKSFYVVSAHASYNNCKPIGVRICGSDEYQDVLAWQEQDVSHNANYIACTFSDYTDIEKTLYLFAQWNSAHNSVSAVYMHGFYIPSV